MPGEDGYALIRKVTALDSATGGGIPSVALTAYTRGEDKMKALAAGFTSTWPSQSIPTISWSRSPTSRGFRLAAPPKR